MAVSLTATLETAGVAVRLEVGGIPAGADTLTIMRDTPYDDPVGVRGAVDANVASLSSYIVRDYEAPFNVALTYTVKVYDGASVVGTATATATLTYSDCEAWLVDLAHPTNSLPLTIESMNELDFVIPSGVHRVLDRPAPVITSLPAWTPSTELIVLTETLAERDSTRALLGSGYPFLLRTDPAQGIGEMYLGPSEFVEERILPKGTAPQRRFRISCVQVERPDPFVYVPLAPNDYAEVKATFATYAAMLEFSYDEIAYTRPGG